MRFLPTFVFWLPSPLTAALALSASLLAAVVLWIDVDPEPRHVAVLTFNGECGKSRRIMISPDGNTLICSVQFQFGDRPEQLTFLVDLAEKRHFVFCREVVDDFVFEPNGTRMAGMLDYGSKAGVWDRKTGFQVDRHRVDQLRTGKMLKPPFVFHPTEGPVLLRGWRIDEEGKLKHELEAVEALKTWHDDGKEFDKLHDAQSGHLIGGTTTPNG